MCLLLLIIGEDPCPKNSNFTTKEIGTICYQKLVLFLSG